MCGGPFRIEAGCVGSFGIIEEKNVEGPLVEEQHM
jgi:hypothetical protein